MAIIELHVDVLKAMRVAIIEVQVADVYPHIGLPGRLHFNVKSLGLREGCHGGLLRFRFEVSGYFRTSERAMVDKTRMARVINNAATQASSRQLS